MLYAVICLIREYLKSMLGNWYMHIIKVRDWKGEKDYMPKIVTCALVNSAMA